MPHWVSKRKNRRQQRILFLSATFSLQIEPREPKLKGVFSSYTKSVPQKS